MFKRLLPFIPLLGLLLIITNQPEVLATKNPELIVQDVWIEPSEPRAGQPIAVLSKIKNIGESVVQGYSIVFKINGLIMQEKHTNIALPPQKENLEYSTKMWFYRSGVSTVEVCVDPKNAYIEVGEDNNCNVIHPNMEKPSQITATRLNLQICPRLDTGYACGVNFVLADSDTQLLIKGNLTDADTGVGLADSIVRLTINSNSTTASTIQNGLFYQTMNIRLRSGTYTLHADFSGEDIYEPCTTSTTLIAGSSAITRNVSIVTSKIEPKSVEQDKVLKAVYTIRNDNALPVRAWIDMSIKRSCDNQTLHDHSNDALVSLPPGISTLERNFKIPFNLKSGLYDVSTTLWNTNLGNNQIIHWSGWETDALAVGNAFDFSIIAPKDVITLGEETEVDLRMEFKGSASEKVSFYCTGLPARPGACEFVPNEITKEQYDAGIRPKLNLVGFGPGTSLTLLVTGSSESVRHSALVLIDFPSSLVQPFGQGYAVNITSSANDGRLNLGHISFQDRNYSLPKLLVTLQSQTPYNIDSIVPEGYAFDHWEASKDIVLSNPSFAKTSVKIYNDGTLKAVLKKIHPVVPPVEERPDLFVEDLYLTPQYPRDGDRVEIRAWVGNAGKTKADNVIDRVLIDGIEVTSKGAYSVLDYDSTLRRVRWNAIAGQHNVTWIVDPNDKVFEGNEDNNVRSKIFTVGPSFLLGRTAPDFDFSLSISPNALNLGPGKTSSVEIITKLEKGEAQPVSLACYGMPEDVGSCMVQAHTIIPTTKSPLKITIKPTSPLGSWNVVVKAIAGDKARSQVLNVKVTKDTIQESKFPLQFNQIKIVDHKETTIKGSLISGREYFIQSEVANTSTITQSFVHIVQVKDKDGKVMLLKFTIGKISSSATVKIAHDWTPQKSGSYIIETYLWDSLDKPNVISASRTVNVTVS